MKTFTAYIYQLLIQNNHIMKKLMKSAIVFLFAIAAMTVVSCKNAETTVNESETSTTTVDTAATDMPATVDTTGTAPVDTAGTGTQKMP